MRWVTADGHPVSREPPHGVTIVVSRAGAHGREWLLLHRAHEGPDYEGEWAWGPPAGARHPGEAVDACARRELEEETGLSLPCRPTTFGDDEWAVYAAEAPADAAVVLSSEHDAFAWLPADAAATRCLPAYVGDTIVAAAATR